MRGHVRKRGKTYSIVIERPRVPKLDDGGNPVIGPDGKVATVRRQEWIKTGLTDKRLAEKRLTEVLAAIDTGTYVQPSQQTLRDYLTVDWLPALRCASSTQVSYRRNMLQHVVPAIGETPLAAVTGLQLTALYRDLELKGRRDGRAGGLSPRTVRYIHTILGRALKDAVRDGRLLVNPADRATPPTAKQAKAPEMRYWEQRELRAFLHWSADPAARDDLTVAWTLLAMTGVRRGELLALRWSDVNLDAKTIAVRRSRGVIKDPTNHRIEEGPTKSGKARVINLDAQTVALLRSHRADLAGIGLQLARDEAYVIGTVDGEPRHPERFSKTFGIRLERCRRELIARQMDPPKTIRLHDLRHTHAVLLLMAAVHPKIVSERLGHATVSITLDVYSHAVPSMQTEAADKLADLVYGAPS
jgi:integrase